MPAQPDRGTDFSPAGPPSRRRHIRHAIAAAVLLAATPAAIAAARGDVVIADSAVFPENIAASRDGALWFGSVAKGTIYRAAPGASVAKAWIAGGTDGMSRSMGLWPDARRGLLWVCAPGERASGTTPAGVSLIKTFDLRTGAPRTSYGFDGGRCNDLTIAADGTVYASDFDGGRVMRLKQGETAFSAWAADPALASVDGLALLGDSLYVNTYRTGTLLRIAIAPDGSAGPLAPIATDRPLVQPDGMRAVGKTTLLMTEGEGRLVELTIVGDRASVRVLKDGLVDSPVGVALVGDTAFVVQAKWAAMRDKTRDPGQFGAVAIPYSPAR